MEVMRKPLHVHASAAGFRSKRYASLFLADQTECMLWHTETMAATRSCVVSVILMHTYGIQYNMLESDPLIYERISAEREYKENAAAMCGGGGVGLKFVEIWQL